jgi:hypothetical protein
MPSATTTSLRLDASCRIARTIAQEGSAIVALTVLEVNELSIFIESTGRRVR